MLPPASVTTRRVVGYMLENPVNSSLLAVASGRVIWRCCNTRLWTAVTKCEMRKTSRKDSCTKDGLSALSTERAALAAQSFETEA